MHPRLSGILKIIAAICLCLFIGGFGGISTTQSVSGWYTELLRPPLTPPSWVFGVIWPCLYVMMGIAAGLIWTKGLTTQYRRFAFLAFMIQLILNGVWSPLFFGLHWIGIALLDIILLWIAIVLTTILFWKESALASVLLWPYLVWVSFAIYLNTGFWIINK